MTQDQDARFILINVFEVRKGGQEPLINSLKEFTETVTRHMPGFQSATVHRGIDGIHVANYVRWQTRADFDVMFADVRARQHMEEVKTMAIDVRPVVYEIAYHCGEQL
jgi:hypothetical protein